MSNKKRWLILTEKPSVSADLAKALGDFEKLGEYYESKEYVITWAVGHLLELLSPEEIDEKYKRWLLQDLPIIPQAFAYKPKSGQDARLKVIKNLFKREDVVGVVNACDAGREGELIFRELYDFCGNGLPIKRLWLQSMTPDAIRREFKALKDGKEFEALGDAARCRAESDWLIGMNGTRAMTRRLRPRTQRGVSWSVGRVQTPTLGLIVDREMLILKHRPEDYYTIEARFSTPTHEYSASWFDPQFKKEVDPEDDSQTKDDRIFSKERMEQILEAVRQNAQSSYAKETRKTSKEGAPQLFDLTMLQREANRRYGMSASRTLQAAQRLYEKHKMLTYPRTDSKYLPLEYKKVTLDVLAKLKESSHSLAKFAGPMLKNGLLNENRVFDDTKISDHFAIIPTGDFESEKLEGDDLRVFDLVLRRYLSAFMESAQWAKVERITTVGKESFRTRASDLEKPGWREVYGKETDEETNLPALVEGQPNGEAAVQFDNIESAAKQTKAPSRYSEARLLSLMESCGKQVENEEMAEALSEKGIGTPATRADIIENLIAKEYVARAGRGLRATAKGIRLLDVLSRVPVTGLSSVELTGDMEYSLKRMERGEGSRQSFMQKMVEYTRDIVEKAKSFDYDALYANEGPLGCCPLHPKKFVRETFWAYKCEEKECEFIIWKEKNQRYIDRSLVHDILEHGKFGPVEFLNSAGQPYEAYLKVAGATVLMCDAEGEVTEVQRGDESVLHEEFHESSFLGQPGRFYETENAYFFEFGVKPGEAADANVEETEKGAKASKGSKTKAKSKVKSDDSAEDGKGSKTKKVAKKKLQARMPKILCGYPVPREEFLKFIASGQTAPITDFKSKKGRPFAASLHLKDNGNFEFKFESRKKLLGEDEKPKKTTEKKASKTKAKVVRKPRAGSAAEGSSASE